MAALRRAGHTVTLAAPRGPAAALVGLGASEVSSVLALDGPVVAALLSGEAPSGRPRFDAILALTRDRELVAALATPPARVVRRDPTPPPGIHASVWSAEPARALGADPEPNPPPLGFTETEHTAAEAFLARLPAGFLALHPGAGSGAKAWPGERFAALARRHTGGGPWLLVVGPADAEQATSLASVPGAVVARGLPVRVLGAVLSRAGLYVGNDSGVSHLAAATGVPTLALFGPTDPATWAPVGPSVETLASPGSAMDRLALETVSEAVVRRGAVGATRTPGPRGRRVRCEGC